MENLTSAFDHFVGLALNGLTTRQTSYLIMGSDKQAFAPIFYNKEPWNIEVQQSNLVKFDD